MPEASQQTILLLGTTDERHASLYAALAGAGYAVQLGTADAPPDDAALPDLVVVEVSSSSDPALAACARIKERPGGRLLPVLALVQPRDLEDGTFAARCAADDYLVQPAPVSGVLARVRSLLQMQRAYEGVGAELQRLTRIGIALSAEHNLDRLLERIVDEARAINHADAGTLYVVDPDAQVLRYQIAQNESLGIRMGGSSGEKIQWPPLQLTHSNVSAHVALTGETVNIPDVYEAEGFDFTGPRKSDAVLGYRSRSMLVVPIRNHEDEIIAVLQLINATDPSSGEVVPFRHANEALTHALASQAGVALTNAELISGLQGLLDGLIHAMATAIDEKSPYTAGHVRRVTRLSELLADAVNGCPDDRFAGQRFTPEELNELRTAGLLHDIGKIVIPEHVVDKATKLHTLYDRIQEIRTRFSVIRRGMENAALRRKLELFQEGARAERLAVLDTELEERCRALEDDLHFLETINQGGEYMADEKLERLYAIAAQTFVDDNGQRQSYLTEDEVANFAIQKGTLLPGEIETIRSHASVGIRLLSQIPFPRKLRHVPRYAGDHHEALNGTGYPHGKTAEELPLQSRILAIADIFDALTASDRPYKRAFTREVAYRILWDEVKRGKLDERLVDLFISANCAGKLQHEELEREEAELLHAAGDGLFAEAARELARLSEKTQTAAI